MNHKFSPRFPSRQKGATLVIALLILVLIMMIGVMAVSTSNTQYKLAGNLQFEDSALNNAETAVETAENWLKSQSSAANNTVFLNSFTSPPTVSYLLSSGASFAPLTMTWDDSNSLPVGSTAQRYVIQFMSTNNQVLGSNLAMGRGAVAVCNKVNTYQITGRGASARGATKLIQSYYSVSSC